MTKGREVTFRKIGDLDGRSQQRSAATIADPSTADTGRYSCLHAREPLHSAPNGAPIGMTKGREVAFRKIGDLDGRSQQQQLQIPPLRMPGDTAACTRESRSIALLTELRPG
jgi:hypothetical protein